MSDLTKNWLQYARNRVARPTSVIMHALSANGHNCMDVLVKVVEITCPSCRIMQMQGARGVCALRALVVLTWPGSAPPIELEHTQLTFLYTCICMMHAA